MDADAGIDAVNSQYRAVETAESKKEVSRMRKTVKLFIGVAVVLGALVFSVGGLQQSWAAEKPAAKKSMAAKQMPLTGPFVKEVGFAWKALLPEHQSAADSVNEGTKSKLVIYENGKPLGPAHSMHDDIRTKGKGRFSHWLDTLYFSTSDNSDPNTNGKKYTYSIQ
jgi:hypothetical protein